MKRLALIMLLIPGIAFAGSPLDTLSSLSHGLEAVRDLADDDLGAIPNGWPCPGHIASGYGFRMHPIFHRWAFHGGVDIANRRGTPIRATGGGVILFAERGFHRGYTGYGNVVVVKHSDHVVSLYGHLDEIKVAAGDSVGRGDIIGSLGNTGRSTGPHLHYEVRVDGVSVDPEDWM